MRNINRTIDGLREAIVNVYNNTARFHWSHAELLKALADHVWNDASYKRLPRWAKSNLDGSRAVLDAQLWKKVTFSYVIKGKRLLLTDDKYRKFSPEYINKNCSHTGAFAYNDAPDKLFTNPSQSY